MSDLNVEIFAGQSASQEPTIFASQLGYFVGYFDSQLAGLTEGLPVGSVHENLIWFHL